MLNLETHLILGGWPQRIAAFLIDALLLIAAAALIGFLAREPLTTLGRHGVWVGLALVLLYGVSVPLIWDGQTIGQKLLGLQVIRYDGRPVNGGQALARALLLASVFYLRDLAKPIHDALPVLHHTGVYLLETGLQAFLALGFFIIPFHPLRMGLHDHATQSIVARKGTFEPAELLKLYSATKIHRLFFIVGGLSLVVMGASWLELRVFGIDLPKEEKTYLMMAEKFGLDRVQVKRKWSHRKGKKTKTLIISGYVPSAIFDDVASRKQKAHEIALWTARSYSAAATLDAIQVTINSGFDILLASFKRKAEYHFSRMGELRDGN